jgi:Methyltransferase domain
MLRAAYRSFRRAAGLPWVKPGHFYSPIVDPAELRKRYDAVFNDIDPSNIDLRTAAQLAMVERLKCHYGALPFRAEKRSGLLYSYDNRNYSYGDAITLGCLLMELRPKRYIEFGSGHSSCAALDICKTQQLDTKCTFIDPYPQLLRSCLSGEARGNYSIIQSAAQDIDLSLIDELEAGDILFIDSTHVSKAGSDVNFHVFNVLPRLKSGVYIHFHDVFFPFEYPPEWFFDTNRSWNEIYLLRAFLTYNDAFEIVLFNHFLGRRFPEIMRAAMPMFMQNPGSPLWLRKL